LIAFTCIKTPQLQRNDKRYVDWKLVTHGMMQHP